MLEKCRARTLLHLFAACLLAGETSVEAAELTVERNDRGVTVKVNGELFTEYLIRAARKPILWPLIGPTGKPMTRAFPIRKVPGEQADHPHHRSFWFTNENLNGVNFWADFAGGGSIVHREFLKVEGGPQAVIATRNDWIGPEGRKHCEDQRTLIFRANADSRSIDFDITLNATDRPVKFNDIKMTGLAIRVPSAMAVELDVKHSKEEAGQLVLVPSKGPLRKHEGGEIVNSEGRINWNAFGQKASWVDYHGPVEGELLGIAMMNHPASFRYPCRWVPRLYGLMAASPFGSRAFDGPTAADGSYTLPTGRSLTLHYRVLLHKGNERTGKVAEAFKAYAKESK